MLIEEFNALPDAEVAAALRTCVAIESWVADLAAGRPFADAAALLDAGRAQIVGWASADVETALADHPRIGERPTGAGDAAAHSRREQSGLDPADVALAERLREGNARYEERFGRIYLVRAKGRSGPELLGLLEERLGNDPVTELEVTRQQLGEIALLRLADLVEPEENR
ncbi:OHCU decarboxylase [Nocardioides sp. Root190]|uniref:2-oxo-4-hydroxy-4-carboxy-5-ureidoimidazoline decarboxylase n=1 Tax=Nocardioides sp. Root190 TaxID=1736488 RepID=UPI0006F4292E|nr:2-oxo-4-hydroxy-4-carboxy-5-ureidoimidazoline decarboxylase [Nocardioides sp. Root190]KRB76944.1 OHCU decarboxylase [Nocardioides sp. Root190]